MCRKRSFVRKIRRFYVLMAATNWSPLMWSELLPLQSWDSLYNEISLLNCCALCAGRGGCFLDENLVPSVGLPKQLTA